MAHRQGEAWGRQKAYGGRQACSSMVSMPKTASYVYGLYVLSLLQGEMFARKKCIGGMLRHKAGRAHSWPCIGMAL